MVWLTRLRQSRLLAFGCVLSLLAIGYIYLKVYNTCCGRDFRLIFHAALGVEKYWQPADPPITDACFDNNLIRKLGFRHAGGNTYSYFTLPDPVFLPSNSANLSPDCLNALTLGSSSSLRLDQDTPFDTQCFKPSLSPANLSQVYRQVARLISNFTSRGLEIFLSDGSLMGSLRHFGVIPWDDDVDFMIRRDQKPQARLLLQELTDRSTATGGSSPEFVFKDTEDINQHWKVGILCSQSKQRHGVQEQRNPTGRAVTSLPAFTCRLDIDLFFGYRAGRWFVRDEWPYYFPLTDVYPLAERPFGPGLLVPSPRRPLHLLLRGYRSDVMQECTYSPHGVNLCMQPSATCEAVRRQGRHPFVVRVRQQQQQQQEQEHTVVAGGGSNVTLELLVRAGYLLAAYLPPLQPQQQQQQQKLRNASAGSA